jgi:hypothetical protein
LFFFGIFQNLTAQKSVEKVELPKPKGNLNCLYKPKYSAKQRIQFYPFNKADTIKLISFRYHRHNYPIIKDSVVIDSILETKVLTKHEIHKLTDILYNNFYKQKPNYREFTNCFYPRNAILFYDQTGHVMENILLCFHCDSHHKSSSKVNFGSNCREKMEKLRKLFNELGLKFGSNKEITQYPGEEPDDGILYK